MSNQSDLAKSAAGFNGDPLSIDTVGTSSPSNPFQVGTSDLIVDSSGTLGLGATPNSSWASTFTGRMDVGGGGLVVGNSQAVHLGLNWYYDGANYRYRNTGPASSMYHYNGDTVFQKAPSGTAGDTLGWTETMRIDSSGNVLVGTTGSLVAGARVRASSIAATFEGEVTQASGLGAVFWANRTSSDGWVAAWYRGGSSVGSISVTSSSTSYNTSSDHRLKENVTDVTDGITRVKQLEPKRFNFIADPDTTVDGFLAHEAQTVVPEAITGTHNQVDDDGNPVYQGIDQSKLVPLLTAALKESIAKIEALEARVTALEGS
jgi:hypothetical protein